MRMEGWRVSWVKVRDGVAGLLSLWVKVFAPPYNVIEVAVEDATIVACRRYIVVEFR